MKLLTLLFSLALLFVTSGVSAAEPGPRMATIMLLQLLYPPAPEGVEQFQADIGAEATGELTGRQFIELGRRWRLQRETPVYASGGGLYFSLDGHGADATGTWLTEDEEVASPVNTSKITCDRARRECLRAGAELQIPSIDDPHYEDAYYLSVSVQRYTIVSWEDYEIVARDTGACTVSLLTLNLNSGEVHEVVRNNDNTPNCQSLKLEKPRISRLTPNFRTLEFWDKRREVASSYLNPRVMGAAEPRALTGPAVEPSDETLPERRR